MKNNKQMKIKTKLKMKNRNALVISIDAMVAVFLIVLAISSSYFLIHKSNFDLSLYRQSSDITALLSYNLTFNETIINNSLQTMLQGMNMALNVTLQNGTYIQIEEPPNDTNVVSDKLVFVTQDNDFGIIHFWAWR